MYLNIYLKMKMEHRKALISIFSTQFLKIKMPFSINKQKIVKSTLTTHILDFRKVLMGKVLNSGKSYQLLWHRHKLDQLGLGTELILTQTHQT